MPTIVPLGIRSKSPFARSADPQREADARFISDVFNEAQQMRREARSRYPYLNNDL
jgi:hypothetical protein